MTQDIIVLFLVFLISQTLSNIIGSAIFTAKALLSVQVLKEEVRERYMNYAKHVSVQNLITGLAIRLDNILVFQHLGAAQLALFSIATVIPDQIKGSSKNIVTLLTPKFVEHHSINSIKVGIPKRSLQLFILLSICSLVLILMIPYIYELFFPKYINAIGYSQLLLLALPASVYFVPLSALQAHLKDKELYQLNISSAVFQITITFMLIYSSGLLGAILARIISRYIQTILTFALLHRTN
jgi:O-antigen/teichoic acid export membrane protein